MNARTLTLCLTLLCTLPFEGKSPADEIAPVTESPSAAMPALTTEEVRDTIEELGSAQFTERQKSLDALRSINAEQIALLADTIENHSDNEVAKRCVELLERKYAAGDRDSAIVRAASEGLEAAAKSERWFVAEAAQDSLARHWKRRVEITLLELQKLGVPMRPRNPEVLWNASQENVWPNRRGPTDDNFLKIFVDEYWNAGPKGFELLGRLSSLVQHDFMASQSRLLLVVIDGHPLQQEEIAGLEAIFGDTRVSKRGRVMLGISHHLLNNGFNGPDEGVNVSGVEDKSSAHVAGIKTHDSLLKFDGSPLRDFDELIELLKTFRPGQEVTFEVRRSNIEAPFDIKVKLKGWYER
ncbi:MAG: PDZ domain-containing protein [Planctomycetota bacterium]|nr:PDZ domain-containing protein [Planctomycetota bacterium]